MIERAFTVILTGMFLTGGAVTTYGAGQWTTEKAWQWYKDAGVIKGCNYLPRTATNTTEMWQAETFDPATIDEELGWAQKLGYNSVRIFVQYLVWEKDRKGFLSRLDTFLDIADKHGITAMIVLFDDCAFGYPPKTDPYLGKQGDPEPGEYAPYWTPSPGHSRVRDKSKWPVLEKYVKDVVGRFKNDKRVLIWDLYNEPGNSGVGEKTRPLVKKSFEWARSVKPSQPLTTCWWVHELCDVITFHNYSNAESMRNDILKLRDYGRPIVNTEWLLRRGGNNVKDILPVFEDLCVGWYHWGLVVGRTQTCMLWTSKKGDPIPENWQHDIFHGDGTPYRAEENEQLKAFTFPKWKVDSLSKQWSPAKARQWYEQRPWPIGCNFLPSTAVNSTEMWQAGTFAPETMDRELGWAEDIGFNSIRVFVQYIVWEADAAGLKQRMEKLLEIADSHGISVMFILFDDCFIQEPKPGKQDDPTPGMHNSQWTASPGTTRKNKKPWTLLEKYVRDIVSHFANDKRVYCWDLYNEPKKESRPLVEKAFAWARQANPSQPLTTCWNASDLWDLDSYHDYGPAVPEQYKKRGRLLRLRPSICTEWMARTLNSRFESHLPLFKKYRIGCYNWGLVAGRTQTYMPWGSKKGDSEPEVWFHDILRKDGTPFDPAEIEIIKNIPEYVEPRINVIVPTSFLEAQTWAYTMTKPEDGWAGDDFDDSKWEKGLGAFGVADLGSRRARTEWKTKDIWLRRTFELDSTDLQQLWLKIQYDESPQIYINGVLVCQLYNYNATYELVMLDERALKAIRPGTNVLAVHAGQTYGGQYIDVGVVEVVSKTKSK